MNKKIVKSVTRHFLFRFRQIKHDRFYRDVMRKNGIENKKAIGEKEWVKKWSLFGLKAKPTQYRVFSHYIGNNINIVPEDICHYFIETILNPMRFRGYYADKNIYDILFPFGYIPRTILRKINGAYYDNDYNSIHLTEQQLFRILNNSETNRIVIKPSVGGMSGKDVRVFYRTNNSSPKWKDVSTDNILDLHYLEQHYGSNIIIQEAAQQSDYISQFNPSSINTLRLAIYRSVLDNKCHVIGAIMRIGGKGSVVDNAHAGGCYVGILPDGVFCHEVYNQYGQKQTTFNDIDFTKNYHYPNWQEVIEFAKSVGSFILHHRLLALDIMLDKNDKPHLIEFNLECFSTWLFQYTTGGAFGEFTDEILSYCKNKQNELEEIIHL
ncbi:MAG: hypothetical protein IKU02_09710 [Bacteroidaceae bacterium]|nr:hypothetical protein [Bacteroidaceae bacterium]